MRRRLIHDVVFFVALIATALALGGGLAHAYELPNKIGLHRDAYFVVQQGYRGWNQLAYVLAVQLLAMVVLAVLSRHQSTVFWPVVIAILGLLGAQAVFWIYTHPANVETNDWTVIPEHWRSLRSQWEYTHAAGAALQLLAMSSLVVAVLARARL